MHRHRLHFLLALLATCIASHAIAQDFRIDYAEPVEPRIVGDVLEFDAFGGRFSATVRPNDQLLRALPAARKQALSAYRVLRGTLAGLPDSWVRVTEYNGEIEGAIWDGEQLFSISTRGRIKRYLDAAAGGDDTQPMMYRLSDTMDALPKNFCGTGTTTSTASYARIVGELRSVWSKPQITGKQLDIALLADGALQSRVPDTTGAMLTVLNIVDGIFSSQVGVAIVAQDVQLIPPQSDPFTTSEPQALLDQVSTYKNSSALLRSRGIVHLMTGKDLTDDTAGIASLGTVCDPSMGVSLSETWREPTSAALIAAHEIAHNFGAQHDGEAGSVCQSAPLGHLMSPSINGSSSFTQCSLDTMEPVVLAAQCLTSVQGPDVSVDITQDSITADNHEPIVVSVRVSSDGLAPSNNVRFAMHTGALRAESAVSSDGTCSVTSSEVRCEFGTMAPGSLRTIDVTLMGSAPMVVDLGVTVNATSDRIPRNNHERVPVTIRAASDGRIAITPTSGTALTNEIATFEIDVSALLTRPLRNASLYVDAFNLDVDSLGDAGVTCTASGGQWICPLGDIAAGTTRRITLRASAARVGTHNLRAQVVAANDADNSNNMVNATLAVSPVRDVGFETTSAYMLAVADEPFDITHVIRSYGVQPIDDVSLRLYGGGSSIDSVTVEGGTCAPLTDGSFECALGTLPAGAARALRIRALIAGSGRAQVQAQLSGSLDDNFMNNTTRHEVETRVGVDAEIVAPAYAADAEGREFEASATIRSLGALAIANAIVRLDVPAEVTLSSTSLAGSACSLLTPQRAQCTLALLEPNQTVNLTMRLSSRTPGVYASTISVDIAGDAVPENNSKNFNISILPWTDVGIEPLPARVQFVGDSPQNLSVIVTTGPRPVPGVTLAGPSAGTFVVESASTPVGSCALTPTFTCNLGTLPENSRIRIDLRVRPTSTSSAGNVWFNVQTSRDFDRNNDSRSMDYTWRAPGEFSLLVAQPSVSARVGQTFTLPRISVTATEPVESLVVEISFPAHVRAISADSGSTASCTLGQPVRCEFGSVSAGISRNLDVQLSAAQAIDFSVQVSASATRDANPSNNSATVAATVAADQPGTGSGGNGGNSGGGGGGAIDPRLAALLGLLFVLRLAGRVRFSF